MGLQRAGFEVTGIDINRQKRYPSRFIQANALQPPVRLQGFDLIWASPPCQGYSVMRNLPWLREKDYPLLIDPVREMLQASGRPWVIENVMGARLPAGWLCGQMFGENYFRHRYFETSFFWLQPGHPPHEGSRAHDIVAINGKVKHSVQACYNRFGFNIGHMGIDWMSRDELRQAIPPVYAEFIGREAMRQMT